MTLIGQVAGVISIIFYGIVILLAIAVLIIVGFAIYKFVMWILYATSSKDKKKKQNKSKLEIIKMVIEAETEYNRTLKGLREEAER